MGRSRRFGGIWAILACVMVASPVAAALITKSYNGFGLPNVTANGNLGSPNPSVLKVYKFTGQTTVVGVATTRVTNDSGKAQIYPNVGGVFRDPETDAFVLAAADVYVVTRQGGTQNAIGTYLGIGNVNPR